MNTTSARSAITARLAGGIATAMLVFGSGCKPQTAPSDPPAGLVRSEQQAAAAAPDAAANSFPQAAADPQGSQEVDYEARLREIEARRRTTLRLGLGMYEMSGATFQPLDDQEQLLPSGLTLRGGAHWNPQIRADMIAGGDVIFNWAVIIKPRPSPPEPNKNPQARAISVNGLEGLEVQDDRGRQGILHWAFAFEDHTVMIMVRGERDRVHSPEVRTILQTLRRVKPVSKELAERAKEAPRLELPPGPAAE